MEPGKRYRKRRAAPEEKGERELGMEGEKLEWKLLKASADGDTHITTVSGGGGGGSCFRPGSPGPIFPTPLSGGKLGNITAGETDGRTRGEEGDRRGRGPCFSPFTVFFLGEGRRRKKGLEGWGRLQPREGGRRGGWQPEYS